MVKLLPRLVSNGLGSDDAEAVGATTRVPDEAEEAVAELANEVTLREVVLLEAALLGDDAEDRFVLEEVWIPDLEVDAGDAVEDGSNKSPFCLRPNWGHRSACIPRLLRNRFLGSVRGCASNVIKLAAEAIAQNNVRRLSSLGMKEIRSECTELCPPPLLLLRPCRVIVVGPRPPDIEDSVCARLATSNVPPRVDTVLHDFPDIEDFWHELISEKSNELPPALPPIHSMGSEKGSFFFWRSEHSYFLVEERSSVLFVRIKDFRATKGLGFVVN